MYRKTRILILCKTYPSPSAKHAETSCVAGMDEKGHLIRLYSVPFRLIADDAQFKKWQWISARIEKSAKDHRPESHYLGVDTIECDWAPLSTRNNWRARCEWLEKLWIYEDFSELEPARLSTGATLAVLRPSKIVELEITPAEYPDWTDDEREKLIQLQKQGNLFEPDLEKIAILRKLPFEFHYRYECIGPAGRAEYKHKIVDWEVGALYWNVRRAHGDRWEVPFRAKIETELPARDLMFLMGTIHRFPDKWLIASLFYPPRQPAEPAQAALL